VCQRLLVVGGLHQINLARNIFALYCSAIAQARYNADS
jgi:hypothetical protein